MNAAESGAVYRRSSAGFGCDGAAGSGGRKLNFFERLVENGAESIAFKLERKPVVVKTVDLTDFLDERVL